MGPRVSGECMCRRDMHMEEAFRKTERIDPHYLIEVTRDWALDDVTAGHCHRPVQGSHGGRYSECGT